MVREHRSADVGKGLRQKAYIKEKRKKIIEVVRFFFNDFY